MNPQHFSLDHFLPWSFVGHDELWKIVPTNSGTSSSKGYRLPDPQFLDGFTMIQANALKTASRLLSARSWRKISESYLVSLRLQDESQFHESKELRRAYEATVTPLLRLAEGMGFPAGWRPSLLARESEVKAGGPK